MVPRFLSQTHFHGGEVCFAADLDFEAPLASEAARLGPGGLDRHLAEVFYCGAAFCLDLGWYDTSGYRDGQWPDGQFILRLTGGRTVLREWRTRDLLELRRYVLDARDRAACLHPRRDLPTVLAELEGDHATDAAQIEALLSRCLPDHRITRRRAWHVDGDRLLWTAMPPLDLAQTEAALAALENGRRTLGAALTTHELDGWREKLRQL